MATTKATNTTAIKTPTLVMPPVVVVVCCFAAVQVAESLTESSLQHTRSDVEVAATAASPLGQSSVVTAEHTVSVVVVAAVEMYSVEAHFFTVTHVVSLTLVATLLMN